MAPFDKELEEQIAVAGNKLIEPPSSLEELLRLLDVSFFVYFGCEFCFCIIGMIFFLDFYV